MDYSNCDYVEGYVTSVIFRNEDNGYTVFSIVFHGEEITCVGMLVTISAGEFITAHGRFVHHPVYDEQFSIQSYEFKEPEGAEAILRYLSSGIIKGIGKKMAERVVSKFADDTFRIMEEEPERLAEIKGISLDGAMQISAQVNEKREIRSAVMFLQKYGISMKLAGKIYERYGAGLYTIIKENPYKLAEEVRGIGFKTADDIAVRAGLKVDSEFRIRSGIIYCLELAANNGHVYLPLEQLEQTTSSLLLLDIPDFDKFLMDLVIDKKIVVRRTKDGTQGVYLKMYASMEANVSRALLDLSMHREEEPGRLSRQIARIEKIQKIELDPAQREAVEIAVQNGVTIITGGPGTGKTTIINTIIRYFESEGLEVALAAPTGRAAKRMSEATGRDAQTIHRLLGINGGSSEDSDSVTETLLIRQDDEPLETDVVIIDEMSMVDIALMNALLKTIQAGTRLILVGDTDQLPSVGPGNVLKDIIRSEEFPVVNLTKIFRQAAESDIVTNAHRINRGEEVELTTRSKDFIFLKRDSADQIISAMHTLLMNKLPSYVGADPSEIQILTPSRKSMVGVDRLNQVMQELVNPAAPGKAEKKFAETIFRVGDKVMQVKNNYQKDWVIRDEYNAEKDRGAGIYNGDTGIITAISSFAQQVTVRFDDGRIVNFDFEELTDLSLAYAITIHKAQGSEYPAVIIPMYPVSSMLMNRNLLYTAVTRAKKCVCLVGQPEIFRQMAAGINEQKRFSSLDERIREIGHPIS